MSNVVLHQATRTTPINSNKAVNPDYSNVNLSRLGTDRHNRSGLIEQVLDRRMQSRMQSPKSEHKFYINTTIEVDAPRVRCTAHPTRAHARASTQPTGDPCPGHCFRQKDEWVARMVWVVKYQQLVSDFNINNHEQQRASVRLQNSPLAIPPTRRPPSRSRHDGPRSVGCKGRMYVLLSNQQKDSKTIGSQSSSSTLPAPALAPALASLMARRWNH